MIALDRMRALRGGGPTGGELARRVRALRRPRSRRPAMRPGAAAAIVAAALLGCGREEARPAPSPAEAEPAVAPTDDGDGREGREAGPEVVFRPAGASDARVSVEVARTRRQLQLGLMYRTHLPPDAGMLFLFARPEVKTFWMKNTLIPLDMIFVSADRKVVGVVENAEPRTTAPRSVPAISQYVIEVNGGWARTHGVTAGVPVEFVGVAPLAPGEGDAE